MPEQVNWLLVGAGRAGACLAAAIERTGGACIAAVVDPEKTDLGGRPIYPSIDDVFSVVQPDAAVIAAPNTVQVAVARTLIDRGVPVLVEKPVGVNAAEATDLRTYAEHARVPAGVVLNQRAQCHSRWIKAQIELQKARPTQVTITGHPPVLEGWQANTDVHGAGLARMIGVHYLDLLLWWFGDPLTAVLTTNRDVEFAVELSFANQCQATLALTCVPQDQASPVRIEMTGPGFALTQTGHVIDDVEGLEAPSDPEGSDPVFVYGPGHLTAITEATTAIYSGTEFPAPLGEILPALKLLERLTAPP